MTVSDLERLVPLDRKKHMCLGTIERRLFHASHQFCGAYAECFRQSNDRSESWTLHAAFNSAQLSSVNTELDVDIELGKTRPLSSFTQHDSKRPLGA